MKRTLFLLIAGILSSIWALIPANAQIKTTHDAIGNANGLAALPQENFFDNFEDSNANGWAPQTPNSWAVVQDQGDYSYHLRTPHPDGDEYSTIVGRTFGDFDMSLRVRSGDNAARNVFVRFGVQSRPNGYYLKFGESTILYVVKAGPNSGVEVRRNTGIVLSDNQYHTLRIVRAGINIKVYIDGVFALEHNDGTFLFGAIDVGSFKGTAYFDDVNIIYTPVQVSFSDDFEDGNANGWSPQTPSSWAVVQDEGDYSYHLWTPHPDGDEYSTIAGRIFGDFDMSLQVRSGDNAARNVFIRFGVQNRPNGYYLKFGESTILYRVTAGPNSGIEIDRNNNYRLSDNQYHTLRIVRAGFNIKVYIDHILALESNDGTYLSGAIDIGSFKGTAYFDDVFIIGSSNLAELVADRIYLRTGPNSGVEITQPVAGQQYYVHLDWRNAGPVAANNFQLEIRLNGNPLCSNSNQSVNANSSLSTWCLAGLTWPAGTNTIEGRLDVNNIISEFNESDNNTSRTYAPIPAPPSNLTVAAISSGQINLSWVDNSTNEDGFRIERKLGLAGAYQEIATVGANVNSYSSTGLNANTQYCYRVRAFNAGGNSSYSNESCATTLPLPPTIFRSPPTMSFSAVAGGTNPSSQPLQINNSGGGTLNWSVSDNQPWLSLSPSSGNSTGEIDIVTVSVNIAGLSVGTHTAAITISAPGATNTPQTTSVTLTITPSNPIPTLTSINPSSGMVGRTIDVVFTGSNFISGLTTVNPGAGITVNSVTVNASISLTANLTITGAAASGARNFSVTNPSPGGGTSNALTFTVTNLTVTSIAPGSGNRLQRLNVVFSGSGFVAGASVNVGTGITINAVTVMSATSLTADITILAAAATGDRNVSVTNPNGETSNSVLFTVTNPPPTLTSISPSIGNRLQTLDVVFTGTNFIGGVSAPNFGSGITVNAMNVTGSTSLTASITITANAAAGSRSFSVTNNTPGGGISAGQNFAINNPAPTLNSISPASGIVGQTLDVTFIGTNFLSDATTINVGSGITVNSVTVTSTMSLTANISIAATATVGAKNFSVSNNSPGGGASGTQVFTVNYPIPTLTGISPARGDRLQTLEVIFSGTNFVNGVTTPNDEPGINVTSVTVTSSTSLKATLEITGAAATGARNFSVSNGSLVSNSQTFFVNNPLPTLTSLAPSFGIAGQTLEVIFTGMNFISGATVTAGANITVHSTLVTAPTSITANLSINAAATGTRSFFVTNPGPGGGTSNSLTFSINPPVTLTSIAPANGNRLQRLNVVFTGTNFSASATSVNAGTGITINSTTVTSATSLTADLTITATAATGPREFSVANSGPNGGTSNPLTFTVNNPSPILTNVSPASGNRLQSLDFVFTGANFINGTSVVNLGPGITTNTVTVNSSTSLTAGITITAAAATGPRNFSVTNSAPGGGVSANQTFAVSNPTPALISVNPAIGVIGQAMDVIFTGTNFLADATTPNLSAGITINSFSVASSTSATANITITSSATAGPQNFSVTNSGPGGGTSGTQIFMVNNPLPALDSIVPASGNRLQTLDVVFTGRNFFNGVSSVEVGSGITLIATTINDATSLTAKIAIPAAAATGPRDFAVRNESPGGGISTKKNFTVNNPVPTLANINPTRGGLGQTLDVVFTGMNFISGVSSVGTGNGYSVVSTVVTNSTSLIATISIAPTAIPGTRIFFVTNSGPGGGTSSNQVFTISNNRAPDIRPSPILPQPEKQGIVIQANITDDSSTTLNATLWYRAGGETIFNSVIMSNTDSVYRGTIPASAVISRGVDYFIVATDVENATTRQPSAGVFSIQIQVSNEARPTAQPNGSAQNAYRLISVPLQLNDPSPAAVLVDDLGSYDNAVWRLFGLLAGQPTSNKLAYAEFPNVGAFASGQSMFLIVRDPNKVVDAGPGQSVRTDQVFSITLAVGHNLVANPFNFDIPLSKLQLQSGGTVALQTYNGSWRPTEIFSPWEGYYLANNRSTTDVLSVNPNLSSGSSQITGVTNFSLSAWRVQISASCAEARDLYNFIGISPESEDGWDDNDLAEPPPIGEYVSVYFPHEEWQKPLVRYSDDMRSASNPNQKWRFVVESNIANEMVTLRFDGLQQIDQSLALFIVDEALNYKQNLRENATYQYQPRSRENTKAFTLIVGKEDFISEQAASVQGAPENFVLEQNFPNPFSASGIFDNPETAIRFGLPRKSAVTIKIFDLTGHEIATLLDRAELPAGRHQRVWDGRDALGRAAPSGVYFYRLLAGSFSKTMKLMLVR